MPRRVGDIQRLTHNPNPDCLSPVELAIKIHSWTQVPLCFGWRGVLWVAQLCTGHPSRPGRERVVQGLREVHERFMSSFGVRRSLSSLGFWGVCVCRFRGLGVWSTLSYAGVGIDTSSKHKCVIICCLMFITWEESECSIEMNRGIDEIRGLDSTSQPKCLVFDHQGISWCHGGKHCVEEGGVILAGGLGVWSAIIHDDLSK